MALIERLFKEPDHSFFLFGPRGTGKSTLMRLRHPDALWIDLLDPEVHRSYLARPERLYEVARGSQNKWIVIDEVQRVPELLSVVHSLIEEKPRRYRFILTGSSARKLKKTGANLLGGRALKCALHPFMAAELSGSFNLSQVLKEGLLPLVIESKKPQEILHAYVSLYLKEEIQAEGLVRSLESFSRFLEVITFSHGNLLNPTNIARESGVKRKTVENYIDILEDLLLAFQLPAFTKHAQRKVVMHPKFYLFDAGVFHILRPKGSLDRPEEIAGASLEGLVAQHLKAWNDYNQEKYHLAFWRTHSGLEVDFVVYGAKDFWAIEVKNAKRVHPQDVNALEIFLKDYPTAKAILLYRGQERLRIRNVLCLPCEDFLLQLNPNQPLLRKHPATYPESGDDAGEICE